MQARSSSGRASGSHERSQSISPGRALARSRTSGSPAPEVPQLSSSPASNAAAPLARTRANSSCDSPRPVVSAAAPSPVPSAPSPVPTPPPAPSGARASPVAPTDGGVGRGTAVAAAATPRQRSEPPHRPVQTFQVRRQQRCTAPPSVYAPFVHHHPTPPHTAPCLLRSASGPGLHTPPTWSAIAEPPRLLPRCRCQFQPAHSLLHLNRVGLRLNWACSGRHRSHLRR